jgi:hypothetical protein
MLPVSCVCFCGCLFSYCILVHVCFHLTGMCFACLNTLWMHVCSCLFIPCGCMFARVSFVGVYFAGRLFQLLGLTQDDYFKTFSIMLSFSGSTYLLL